jgi:hypothetical protein
MHSPLSPAYCSSLFSCRAGLRSDSLRHAVSEATPSPAPTSTSKISLRVLAVSFRLRRLRLKHLGRFRRLSWLASGDALHLATSPISSPFASLVVHAYADLVQQHSWFGIRSQNRDKKPCEAGATPPFDARCVTAAVRSLPPRTRPSLCT